MDDEYRKWIETMLQGQRDLEDMEKQRKAESDAKIQDARKKVETACAFWGITPKDFANIYKAGVASPEAFERAVKQLINSRKSK